ncbi:histidine kinase [Pseudomonas flexibilis]|uniref:Histidine kinase n=1 Tax=Pseudomonas flexibilis TaxID=706570 RepID=A0A0B3BZ09_9PSED|nr:histidine kinase [Pseudomonas flexibilis]KHO64587.1 histidine kinase [Pseudomonas flexibilis]SCY01900.1 Uncharacterized membrane protein affecting hemolysin expression [Pseudomonas flexibilis]
MRPDNLFLRLFDALSGRTLSVPLRITGLCLGMVALVLLLYAWVIGTQLRQTSQQQANVVGQTLVTQTAATATSLLVANDILSLNVLLGNLVKNPLVAHAAVYSTDNRILAEAGSRPADATDGLFATPISFQEVLAGQLRISLDMQHFRQPLSLGLQSMALLSLILLAAALWLSLLAGRSLANPLIALGHWVRDPQGLAPGSQRQDEIGELARSLQARLAPLPEPAPAPEPEQELDLDPEADPELALDDEPELEAAWQPEPGNPRPQRAMAHSLDEDDPFLDLDEVALDEDLAAPALAARSDASACAVLAVQIGQQDQLRRLPRQRLVDLLDRYRHCLEQASSLYQGELHILRDGSSLVLFHQRHDDDYLGHALCCGELLRALGHSLQLQMADTGQVPQLQLSLCGGALPERIGQGDLLLSEPAQQALALAQHSRTLLLTDAQLGVAAPIRERARLRPTSNPPGAYCVESLLPPYPALIERQLGRFSELREGQA